MVQPSGPEDVVSPPRRHTRIRNNFAIVLSANLAVMALNFLTGTLNARLLGPGGRGELSAIQNVATTFGAFALIGLPVAVGFFSSRTPAQARSIASTAFVLCSIVSLPCIAVAYLCMPIFLRSQPAGVVTHARHYLAYLLLQPALIVPFIALQGLGKFRIWSLLRVMPNVAAALAILLTWMSSRVTAGTLAERYLELYALIIPFGLIALRANSRGPVGPRRELVSPLLRYGLPSALMVPAGLLNLQLDQLLMAAWFPSRLLGLYAVSVSWSSLISPVFSALGATLFPTLAAIDDPGTRRVLVGRSMRSAVPLVTLLGLGLCLVTPFLLPLFFGQSFTPAIPVALVLVAASVLLNLSGLCGEILRGLGHPRWPLYSQLAALPVTVILMVVLLSRYTMVGAAVASVCAYATALGVCIRGISRSCDLKPRELLVPTRADLVGVFLAVKAATLGRIRRAP